MNLIRHNGKNAEEDKMKRKKVTVIFHSLYDGKDYKFKKRGKRK